MKRIETLVKEAREHLANREYVASYKLKRNDVDAMDMARALDKIREGERVLRQAFGDGKAAR